MAWKGVHVSKPARLSWKDTQLVVAQDDATVTMPLEDLAWIIIDTQHVTLTASLIAACMAGGVAIVFADDRHMPAGMALSFHQHHKQSGISALQLAATLPLKKRLWQAIVVGKIENQAACLERSGKDGTSLRAMARRVTSGDPDNIEAQSARAYWSLLFEGFTRSGESDVRNMMLNYGYAVLRAGIARSVVAYGLLPSVGLFHASDANAFNLVDDLIEPFRPLVDIRVAQLAADLKDGEGTLSVDHRRALAGILNSDCVLQGETVSVLIACERSAESLVRALSSGEPKELLLPTL
jgi:CRISP-associated protein Cas1